jgi:tetratricopeptide (TPR) repeat protein/O-antigen ligase
VVAPQLLGGGRGWAIAITAGLSGLALIATLHQVRRARVEVRWNVVLAALVAMLAWTLIQALPLPRALVEAIAPDSVSRQVLAYRWFSEEPPALVALSRSSAATWAACVQLAAILALATAAAGAIALGHRRRLLRGIAISTWVMALVALAHTAVGTDRIFGVWVPRNVDTRLLAPLTNENHLGGFLGMGAPLAAGLALESHGTPRALWALAAAITTATTVLTMSRGGLVSLLVGILVFGGLVALASRRGRIAGPRPAAVITASAALASALAFAMLLAARTLREEWFAVNADKLRIALLGVDLIAQRPWIGVGRGAYSEALVQIHGSATRYEYPENLILQWLSEWGVPFGLAMLVVLGRAWLRAAREVRSPSHAGALAAVASIAVHDLVDFALERLGVAVCAAVVLACATIPSQRRGRRGEPPHQGTHHAARPLRTPAMAAIATTALAAALLVGPRLDGWDVHAIQSRMRELIAAEDWPAFDAMAREAVLVHPSEPAFPLLVAHAALVRGDPRTPAWLNRAMTLAPGWASPHHHAARWLSLLGAHGQAWLELREAERRVRFSSVEIGCALARRAPDAVPLERWRDDEVGAALLDRVAECLGFDDPVASRIDEVLDSRSLPDVAIRTARRLLRAGRPEEALAALDRLGEGAAPRAALYRADAHSLAGRHQEAIAILDAIRDPEVPREQVLYRLAVAHAHAGSEDAMRAAVAEIRGLAAGSVSRIAAADMLLGRLEQQLGNRGRAMRAFEAAHRIDPSSEALDQIANLASAMGDSRRAYQAWAEICRRDGPSSPACERQRRALAPSGLPPDP